MTALHHFASLHPIAFLVIGWFVSFAAYMWVLWMVRRARRAARSFERPDGSMWD